MALRFANVYGPWSARKKGAMTTFFKAIHAGEPIVIYGDGSASRDYTHVDDISRALQLALELTCPAAPCCTSPPAWRPRSRSWPI